MTKPTPFRFEPEVSYADGIAIIATPKRKSTVHVGATADAFIDGPHERPTKTDALALALGYRALAAEVDRLQAELVAARAGTIGKEHAEAMHGARKVIAELNQTGNQFLAAYDEGNAPDGELDEVFRDKLDAADTWLLLDVTAAGERAKILKGGAA